MPEPTIWDLFDSLFPDDKKAITFICPECKTEGHFLIVHCACSFNATICLNCLPNRRMEAIMMLDDHGRECASGRDLVGVLSTGEYRHE